MRRALIRPSLFNRLWLLALLAAYAPLSSAALRVQAPPEVSRVLAPYLAGAADSPASAQALFGEILATEGYFSPSFSVSGSEESLLTIDPGPRTRVGALDIRIDGPIALDRREALTRAWSLRVGDPFRQADWDKAKEELLRALLASEHAGASLVESVAEIDAEARTAKLSAHYDAGARYRFGELRIVGLTRYDEKMVLRYNKDVHPGAPYSETALEALRSRLQATPYFSAVEVSVDTSAAPAPDSDGTVSVPVVVRLGERPRQRVSFGAGVSSNTGARVEVSDNALGFFNQPWQLNSGLRIEQKKQTAYADIFLPPDEKDRLNSTGALIERSDIENLKTERYAIGAQTVETHGRLEQRLAINWQAERSTPAGGEATTSRALSPSVTWTWRHVDNLLDPREGVVLQGQIGFATKAVLSDQDFVRLHARYQQYLPLGPRDSLLLRSEIGATLAKSRDHIPQEYLFRTGGAGSVRGYTYQSLGVPEANATVGGRYLAVASAEVTHWLNPSWGIAGFIDAGDAFDATRGARLAVGYGGGARWRSPAGPIGVDLAYGERERSWRLHFALVIPF